MVFYCLCYFSARGVEIVDRYIVSQCIMELLLLSGFSRVRLSATLWTVAYQAPLCLAFSRQEYQSGLPCPPPGDLPDQWIEPASLRSWVLADRFFTGATCVAHIMERH